MKRRWQPGNTFIGRFVFRKKVTNLHLILARNLWLYADDDIKPSYLSVLLKIKLHGFAPCDKRFLPDLRDWVKDNKEQLLGVSEVVPVIDVPVDHDRRGFAFRGQEKFLFLRPGKCSTKLSMGVKSLSRQTFNWSAGFVVTKP